MIIAFMVKLLLNLQKILTVKLIPFPFETATVHHPSLKPNHRSFYYLPLHTQEDISIEPLVQIANGNQCSVKPLRNDLGLDSASGLHK